MAEPLVAVRALAKSYGKRRAVQGVDLTLSAGQMIGLVGANGGGKTTTLRMIAGVLKPDAGSGHVLGLAIGRSDPRRRQGIGYMTQRAALYPDLTVAENLAFHAAVIGPALPKSLFEAAIETYGIAPVLNQRFAALSGGWARRVQFVATILHQPRLLLLDEPTAGLDIVTRRLIWKWLADFAAAGCGIIVSTHDLSDAERCDLILPYLQGEAHSLVTPAAFIRHAGAQNLEDAMMRFASEAAA
ncbi:MAG: ABC transporter ATP-binding protein [Novosphingobium sp.]